ncbi:MAG: hypothetical protein ABFS17_07020 [Chloroflexota bacterium]
MVRKIALSLSICLLLLSFISGSAAAALAAQNGEIAIFSPLPGQAVQGLVQIIGSVGLDGLQSYQLSFAFKEDITRTWFLIAQGDTPVSQGRLGEWDTTVLTDSIYDLKLTAVQNNGAVTEVIVESIRVRNYTAVETSTPAPTHQITEQELTQTAASIPRAQPTMPPFPTEAAENPASLNTDNITQAVKRGAILGAIGIAILLFALRPKGENNRL